MSLSAKLRETTASIAAAHEAMEQETKEAKVRFFAFVDEHNIPLGYVDYPWSPGQPASILEDVDIYYLCTGYNSPTGITFGHDTYDGTESVHIPYEYFDDADAWEAQLLERIAADRRLAEEVVGRFGKDGAYDIVGIRLDGAHGARETISVEVAAVKRPDGYYGINPFLSIDPRTGEITYASYDLEPVLKDNGIEIKR